MTKKLKYDPFDVRPSFRSHWCKELSLPSGKGSGYYLNPITTEEVIKLTEDCTDKEYETTVVKQIFNSPSEYLMWVALRRKYGVTYMQGKMGWRPIQDSAYGLRKQNEFVKEIRREIDAMGANVFDELDRKIIDLQLKFEDLKKDKIFLDERLTTPETML